MNVRTIGDAKKAAQLHGLDTDPDHEIKDLRAMIGVVWRFVPKEKQPEVLAKLQEYVEETCLVAHYPQTYDVRHHPCHPDHDG